MTWLTAKEAAEHARVGIKVIYRAAKTGRLKGAQIDGRGDYRFKQEWVDDWIERMATPTELRGGIREGRGGTHKPEADAHDR